MTRLTFVLTALLATALALPAAAQGSRHDAEIIVPERWKKVYERWHFSPAVKIGDTIYLSGVVGSAIDGDMEAGFVRAFELIDEILKEAGSGLGDVVEMTTFHTDITAQIEVFSAVKDRFITPPYPAWTAIDVDRLVPDDGLVEIRVVARLSQ